MRLLRAATALLLGCAAGCASDAPPPRSVEGVSTAVSSAPCVGPSPLARPPSPPLSLPQGAVLTDVTEQAGQRLVTGQLGATVEQVLAHFRSDPGYVVTRDEDEGRSGRLQLFGARGEVGITVALLTCPRGLTGFTISTPVTQTSPPR